MNSDAERVFYLVPVIQKDTETILLSFPSDLDEITHRGSTVAYGLFIFLRHESNRGQPRRLIFPAIEGFGENSREIEMPLESEYRLNRNANRFFCDGFHAGLSFAARKLPKNVRLVGAAQRLNKYNLWALVPDNRDVLEELWVRNGFYFMGYGK